MTASPPHQGWTIERIVPMLGGLVVLASVVLILAFSIWWLILTTFVAANLLLYSAVGWCPMSLILQRFGIARLGAG